MDTQRTLDEWFALYGVSHCIKINKAIHFLAVKVPGGTRIHSQFPSRTEVTIMPRFVMSLLAPLLLMVSSHVAAATPSALSVATDLYLLIAETTMVTAGHEPDAHAAKAKEILRRLDSALPPVISTVSGQSTERATELQTHWDAVRNTYDREPFMAAFREQNYDYNANAHYDIEIAALLEALDPVATAEAAQSSVQALKWKTLKTVVIYLQVATNLTGGNRFSASDENNDLPTAVAAVDKRLSELKQKFPGKPSAATLNAAIMRWQFIKPALLKSTGQSAPYIVYTHGLKVVQTLDELETAPAR